MGVKIWIDDIRPAPTEEYRVCKTYTSAIATLKYFVWAEDGIELCSFDHDLGEGKSGYDVAKFIVEHRIPVKNFSIHSMNPVGAYNIRQLMTHYGYHEI